MENVINEFIGKAVHIVFNSPIYHHGGIIAADYKVLGYSNGFLKLLDWRNEVSYFNLSSICNITLLDEKKSLEMEASV